MRSAGGVFQEFSRALQFPDYFGANWAALDECLTDLSWLPARGYLLVINDADQLLTDGSDEELQALLEILRGAGVEWASPIALGEPWDRPACPFHTILRAEEPMLDGLRKRLASVGIQAVTLA